MHQKRSLTVAILSAGALLVAITLGAMACGVTPTLLARGQDFDVARRRVKFPSASRLCSRRRNRARGPVRWAAYRPSIDASAAYQRSS